MMGEGKFTDSQAPDADSVPSMDEIYDEIYKEKEMALIEVDMATRDRFSIPGDEENEQEPEEEPAEDAA